MLNKLLGGIFLIAGTSIGAGMIGIPIKILGISFNTSIIIFLLSWFIIFIASIAMLEISFWFNNNENIMSITKNIYGKKHAAIISTLYILFFYSLIIAYISGSCSMISDTSNYKSNIIIKLIFIVPFFLINFYGITLIDKINKVFFLSNNIIFNISVSNYFYKKFKYRSIKLYRK